MEKSGFSFLKNVTHFFFLASTKLKILQIQAINTH